MKQRRVRVARLLSAVLAAGLVVAIAAPAGAQDKGKLKVATSLPAPGFWGGEDDAKPSDITEGFEYDLASEIATRLGYDGFSLKNVSFDALVAGKAKGYDLALSQVSITPERKKVVGFSVPYFESDQGILVKTGTTVDESNIKTIQWGVQGATTGQTFLKEEVKPDKKARSYQETTQAFAALQAGQIDAVLLDTAIVLVQAKLSDSEFDVVGQFESPDPYGAVFPKGSKLRKQVNGVIEELDADGTLARLAQENLGKSPDDLPVLEP